MTNYTLLVEHILVKMSEKNTRPMNHITNCLKNIRLYGPYFDVRRLSTCVIIHQSTHQKRVWNGYVHMVIAL